MIMFRHGLNITSPYVGQMQDLRTVLKFSYTKKDTPTAAGHLKFTALDSTCRSL